MGNNQMFTTKEIETEQFLISIIVLFPAPHEIRDKSGIKHKST